eukprot:Sspe_Gene.88548::Locus_60536_Transcript_1_1_Confidence_1.000_Length_1683::g.88548::m.88548/K13998/DHFR-TS; dihydrofolate reductase / thymidylate synthase
MAANGNGHAEGAKRWKVYRNFDLILAADSKGGIGKEGKLPWHLPGDMKFFKETTLATTPSAKGPAKRNVCIMGRKTWESIPERYRPLKDRINVVCSSTMEAPEGVHVVKGGLAEALEFVVGLEDVDKVFVIGGAALYSAALSAPLEKFVSRVFITRVSGDFECDTHVDFPEDPRGYLRVSSAEPQKDGEVEYVIQEYHKVNREERQYLDLVEEIILTGNKKGDRTGVGTLSKFGAQMRFDLRDGRFPLLTTKRVFWKGVAEELLWFIKGCTDARVLKEKGVGIWDGNGTREFLDSRGLQHREEGDLGPIYGFQWRHFGAEYTDCHADYTGKGIDQLQQVIDTIKNNPNDRRIIMSAWNPAALHEMALPPCHVMCQFYVFDGELSCQMYQRSCDLGLGVPFNIASYALLTCLIARVTGLRPGDFIHTLGDAHVYSNHVDPLREQLKREPRCFPSLKILREHENIEDFTMDDFAIVGYSPYPTIKMEMAV